MDWPKVKTTLIFFLLLVNLVLGTILFYRVYENNRIEKKFLADTVSTLGKLGVEVDVGVLEGKSDKIYTLEMERDFDLERASYEAIIGSSSVEDQGSGIYSLTGEFGSARISSTGSFEVTLKKSGLVSESSTVESVGKEVLEIMGVPEPADIFQLSHEDDGYTLLGTQVIRTHRVFNRQYSLFFDTDGLYKMQGGRLLGTPLISDVTPSRSVTTVLFSFVESMEQSGTPCREITAASLGYAAEPSAPGYTRLFPVWEVESDLGTYYMDALTLELYRQLP